MFLTVPGVIGSRYGPPKNNFTDSLFTTSSYSIVTIPRSPWNLCGSVLFLEVWLHQRIRFFTMLESAMLSSNREIFQRMVSDLDSPAKYSIVHDFVMIWDDLEKIGHHTFSYEFWVVPEEHPIVFTRALVNPKTKQEMTLFMFGTFNVPAMYVAILVGLSSYATRHNGHRDGFVRCCVAQSFPSTKRRESVSLCVETYRTEVGSLMAYVITFARRSTKIYLLVAFSDASFSPRRVTSHSPTSWAPSCSKRSTRTSPKS